MLRRFFVLLGRYGIYFLVFLIGWLATYSWFKKNFLEAYTPGSVAIVNFEVPKGASLTAIAEDLEKQQLLRWYYSLVFLSKIRAGGDKIIAGEYEVSPGMTPAKLLEVLVSGNVVKHNLTITEGTTVAELPKLMAKTSLVTEEQAAAALNDRSLLMKLSIPSLTPEGFIFPETYSFSRPVTAHEIVERIVEEGRKRLDERLKGWKERGQQLGFNPYQILVLASIIEKETGKAEERGVISSVFHNRLRIAMPLQSDPTVIYGVPNFDGNLTKEHLKTPGPYNTYLNTGLPPTPICNPGLEAIKAAVYPEDTDYLYFVGKGDGSHHFSATYKEHQRAVDNFQRR